MEIESMFLNSFSIEKKHVDICELIEAAIIVGALKHPAEFEKRKNKIFNMIMHPGDHDDLILDDEEEEEDSVGDEDDLTNVEEPEKEEQDALGTQQINVQSKKPLINKIKVVIKKTVQVAPLKKQNYCNAITALTESSTELKKRSETDLVQQLDAADKQGTTQSHNTTTMASRKRMSLMNESTKRVEVAPPSVRLLSDFSFEKQLDGDKQFQKQSHKGFKKMESDHDTEKKREGAQQTPTQRRRKECTTGLTKMNVATKPVQVAPHQKELSDCSIRRPMQKETQNSSVARPMHKEIQSINDMKKKFESSKRKFEERLAEQREAKRRIVMVDFHDMPKPAYDSRAPRRRCWGRKRF